MSKPPIVTSSSVGAQFYAAVINFFHPEIETRIVPGIAQATTTKFIRYEKSS
jgi:hypothetical protein